MNIPLKRVKIYSIITVVIFSIPSAPSCQTIDGWKILSDGQGKVASMLKSDTLNIEKEIVIDIDQDGNLIRGKIKFLSGYEREMQPRETAFYREEFNGPHAWWDYLSSQGRIVSIDPKTSALPLEAFGRLSRVITDSGKEYVGKINAIPLNSDWFMITIADVSLNVHKQIVRVIQQMK